MQSGKQILNEDLLDQINNEMDSINEYILTGQAMHDGLASLVTRVDQLKNFIPADVFDAFTSACKKCDTSNQQNVYDTITECREILGRYSALFSITRRCWLQHGELSSMKMSFLMSIPVFKQLDTNQNSANSNANVNLDDEQLAQLGVVYQKLDKACRYMLDIDLTISGIDGLKQKVLEIEDCIPVDLFGRLTSQLNSCNADREIVNQCFKMLNAYTASISLARKAVLRKVDLKTEQSALLASVPALRKVIEEPTVVVEPAEPVKKSRVEPTAEAAIYNPTYSPTVFHKPPAEKQTPQESSGFIFWYANRDGEKHVILMRNEKGYEFAATGKAFAISKEEGESQEQYNERLMRKTACLAAMKETQTRITDEESANYKFYTIKTKPHKCWCSEEVRISTYISFAPYELTVEQAEEFLKRNPNAVSATVKTADHRMGTNIEFFVFGDIKVEPHRLRPFSKNMILHYIGSIHRIFSDIGMLPANPNLPKQQHDIVFIFAGNDAYEYRERYGLLGPRIQGSLYY